jgi:hypothetical protein
VESFFQSRTRRDHLTSENVRQGGLGEGEHGSMRALPLWAMALRQSQVSYKHSFQALSLSVAWPPLNHIALDFQPQRQQNLASSSQPSISDLLACASLASASIITISCTCLPKSAVETVQLLEHTVQQALRRAAEPRTTVAVSSVQLACG